mmetsp:Transcript_16086/g.2662  ORF Transcript_16086/g.2662 Transcript_16086/m.2662 type:complete len:111 (+) Transcript_16086:993-1325(+)
MRSELLDLDYWYWFCNMIFDYPGGLPLPNTNSTASYLSYEGSNIIYINGGEDPWQWASVRQWESELRPAVLVDCNDCGHCVDLYTPTPDDPPELKSARRTIANYIANWLD